MWITWDKKLAPTRCFLFPKRSALPVSGSAGTGIQPPGLVHAALSKALRESKSPCTWAEPSLFPTCLSGPTSSRSAWSSEPPLLVDHTFLQGRAYFYPEMPGANNAFIPSCSPWHTQECACVHVHTNTVRYPDGCSRHTLTQGDERQGRQGTFEGGAKLTGGLCFAEKVTWTSQGCGHYVHKV